MKKPARIRLSPYASMPNNWPRVYGRLRHCVIDAPAELAAVLVSEGLAVVDTGAIRVLESAAPTPPRREAEAAPDAKRAPEPAVLDATMYSTKTVGAPEDLEP